MIEQTREDGHHTSQPKGLLKRLTALFFRPLTQAQLEVLAQVKPPCC
ncbi:hypothetical protein [Paragemmobacter ruber]|uniref:Uncharacterized protein n=1 Tax=Paragemmobacter ruber TaxID=1985673 RepID=A0ABW9Y5A8_9RHOB|nr:hypothetical protein [Rhodobacter ruber]NBE07757.1 hypothetical protein [Rhodobacter ruber]